MIKNSIQPLSHSHIKALGRLKQKKFRLQEQKFIAEGSRLCEEAILAHARIQEILVSKEDVTLPPIHHILNLAMELKIPVFEVSQSEIKFLTDTQTPQGVVCVVNKRIPPWGNFGSPLLCLDNIKDPGNLGTILRSADWFGIKSVFTSRSSVELYNPKVVRSTMGAIFRIAVYDGVNMNQFINEQRIDGYRIIASVSQGGVSLKDFCMSDKDVLLIGNETAGLSRSQYPIDLQVTIPTKGRGDSLNAAIAASIILYEFSK
jgi:RNA methyltransferase, TrmH family